MAVLFQCSIWSRSVLFANQVTLLGVSRLQVPFRFVTDFFFWENKTWRFMWNHMKCQALFSEKIKNCLFAPEGYPVYPCPAEYIKCTMPDPLIIFSHQIMWSRLLIQSHILNDKQCRSNQLASEEANWSGSTLFVKQDISGFSRTRVKYFSKLIIGLDKSGYEANSFSYFSTKTYIVGTL